VGTLFPARAFPDFRSDFQYDPNLKTELGLRFIPKK
jgi:hypothetical protein